MCPSNAPTLFWDYGPNMAVKNVVYNTAVKKGCLAGDLRRPLPIPLPLPTNRRTHRVRHQNMRQRAVVGAVVIFQPIGVFCLFVKISRATKYLTN